MPKSHRKIFEGNKMTDSNIDMKNLGEEFEKLRWLLVNAGFANATESIEPIQAGTFEKLSADVQWSKRNKHTEIYADFIIQLHSVEKSELKSGDTEIYSKMRFSYAVTLMESCLCEMLKSLAMQYDGFRRNAINNINDLKNLKIAAPLLLDKNPKEILDSAIMGHLSHILYHNIEKVSKVYCDVLGDDFPDIRDNVNKRILEHMTLRHDIVHRNGIKINGEKIEMTPDMVAACILDIRAFVFGVHAYIMRNVEKLKEKSI